MAKNKIKIVVILLLILGAVFIYYVFDPATNKYFPGCPFYNLTGLFCPGCGTQRSMHHLLTGNIIAATHSNILLVIFLPFLLSYYAIQTFNYFKPQNSIRIGIVNKVWFIYLLTFIVVYYWIARNIPFLEAGYLAPH